MSTYYALVNLNSESVRRHLDEIHLAIQALSSHTGCTVDFDYPRWLADCPEGWQHVDLQLQRAKGYAYLLAFGGDGTHTYVLNRMTGFENMPQLIGIGCGTMNIGSISNPLKLLSQRHSMQTLHRDAICCQTDGGEVSHCLIDSVITTTCVGRIDGKISQFSAEGILRGIKCHALPEAVGDAQTSITVQRKGDTLRIPGLHNIFTVSAAFLPPTLGAQVLADGTDKAVLQANLIYSDAETAFLQKNYDLAKDLCIRADKLKQGVDDETREIRYYAQRGKIELMQKNTPEASQMFYKGLECAKRLKRLDEITKNTYGCAICMLLNGQRHEAENSIRQLLKTYGDIPLFVSDEFFKTEYKRLLVKQH